MSCDSRRCTDSKMTFEQLATIWINEHCEPNYSPIVVKNYKRILNNWLLPEFAKIPLVEISPLLIGRFLEKLKKSETKYKKRQNNYLSNGSIKKIYEVFRDVIKLAYRNDIIEKDPCSKIKLDLKKEISSNEEIHFWNIEEYTRALSLLEVEKTSRALVIELALKTGLRRSEMFGLTWEDINLEDKYITVNKTRQLINGEMMVLPCKTQSSIRKISIPDSIAEKLKKQHLENMDTEYVLQNVNIESVTAWFRDWVSKKHLPKIRFHDLRHTHATLLLSQGIDVKTISKRLGHSNISTTLNTYTHVLDELDHNASEVLDKISTPACI